MSKYQTIEGLSLDLLQRLAHPVPVAVVAPEINPIESGASE
jgi:hypothetical protein